MKNALCKKEQKVINEIIRNGYEIGGISSMVSQMTYKELDKIISHIRWATTDVDIYIKKKLHVAEIVAVDMGDNRQELDVVIMSQAEYISRYGDERWDDEE